MMPSSACPCSSVVFTTIEWECGRGHQAYAALCREHGAIHVAALLSGDIRCGRCRLEDGRETAVSLRRINGKAVGQRLGRTTP